MKSPFTNPNGDVGVIVGRFQVHELHEAHRALIDKVASFHSRVLVFIGLSVLRNTKSNPLDFNARKQMFAETYPEIEVYYIEDQRSDEAWSEKLDREIDRQMKPGFTARLYGSRDSFITRYHGKYPTTELEADTFISGTEQRRRIANNYHPTKDFRAGAISAAYNRYATCFPTVDIAPLKQLDDGTIHVLLGKKPGATLWRFLGGFADPRSLSYEDDARRELTEEAGINMEVTGMTYLSSHVIDDWRYQGEDDKIKTLFFTCAYCFGRPEAGDDIAEVGWHDAFLINGLITPEHKILLSDLQDYVRTLTTQK